MLTSSTCTAPPPEPHASREMRAAMEEPRAMRCLTPMRPLSRSASTPFPYLAVCAAAHASSALRPSTEAGPCAACTLSRCLTARNRCVSEPRATASTTCSQELRAAKCWSGWHSPLSSEYSAWRRYRPPTDARIRFASLADRPSGEICSSTCCTALLMRASREVRCSCTRVRAVRASCAPASNSTRDSLIDLSSVLSCAAAVLKLPAPNTLSSRLCRGPWCAGGASGDVADSAWADSCSSATSVAE
mmetsp:Transcript_12472/g.26892  ORF Transcript_12472/g.26892 Transcript_12472/m.26892 type:complete len:246 (-) Transcript_12472:987-1724(-)